MVLALVRWEVEHLGQLEVHLRHLLDHHAITTVMPGFQVYLRLKAMEATAWEAVIGHHQEVVELFPFWKSV